MTRRRLPAVFQMHQRLDLHVGISEYVFLIAPSFGKTETDIEGPGSNRYQGLCRRPVNAGSAALVGGDGKASTSPLGCGTWIPAADRARHHLSSDRFVTEAVHIHGGSMLFQEGGVRTRTIRSSLGAPEFSTDAVLGLVTIFSG